MAILTDLWRIWNFLMCFALNYRSVKPLSGCLTVEIINSFAGYYDGVYTKQSDMCTDRSVYAHKNGRYVMYFVDRYWVIYNTQCDIDGINNGYARVKDSATYPEYIVQDWETFAYGDWRYDFNMYVNCADDENGDGMSGGAIVGTVLGCVVGSFILVTIFVGCMKAVVKRRATRRQAETESGTANMSSQTTSLPESCVSHGNRRAELSGYVNPGATTPPMEFNSDLSTIPIVGLPKLPSYEEAVRIKAKYPGESNLPDVPPLYDEIVIRAESLSNGNNQDALLESATIMNNLDPQTESTTNRNNPEPSHHNRNNTNQPPESSINTNSPDTHNDPELSQTNGRDMDNHTHNIIESLNSHDVDNPLYMYVTEPSGSDECQDVENLTEL